ncbi:hypothetical protein Rsub_08499 [Raphidocelis subcapitata]|uniref:Uncharacterized protein n=1 Tax=Raphidocelis subcapitata TaxID=307507 RepID=A0A2V0P7S1_9CHLO|nr:hypothetical protein Rsub_08499 [Raphidocelis subcapitata]|eukprot:GBF95908.1 hypothetical protein Rsub_08499 [Raphidocelis subcapitata]
MSDDYSDDELGQGGFEDSEDEGSSEERRGSEGSDGDDGSGGGRSSGGDEGSEGEGDDATSGEDDGDEEEEDEAGGDAPRQAQAKAAAQPKAAKSPAAAGGGGGAGPSGPVKRPKRVVATEDAVALIEGMGEFVREALCCVFHGDDVARAMLRAREQPEVRAMSEMLAGSREALEAEGARGGGGGGRGGGARKGARGGGSSGRGGGRKTAVVGPSGAKGIYSNYLSFVSLGIAHLRARGSAELANKKTIAEVWGKLPADVKAGVEERLGGLKAHYNAAVAKGTEPPSLPAALVAFEARRGLDHLDVGEVVERYKDLPSPEAKGAAKRKADAEAAGPSESEEGSSVVKSEGGEEEGEEGASPRKEQKKDKKPKKEEKKKQKKARSDDDDDE